MNPTGRQMFSACGKPILYQDSSKERESPSWLTKTKKPKPCLMMCASRRDKDTNKNP